MKKFAKATIFAAVMLLSLTLSACTGAAVPSPDAEESTQPTASPTPTPTPIPTPDASAAYIYEAHPNLTPVDYTSDAILTPTEDAGQEYIDKLIFLCDSTLYGLQWYNVLTAPDGGKTKQIWTGDEGTLTLAYVYDTKIVYPEDGTMRTILEAVELKKPEYLVITLGVNGISFMDEEYFKNVYTQLVTDIQTTSPDTIILLQSIFPISPTYKYWSSINNDKVTAANSWVLDIAEQTGCKYLDTISVLMNNDGNAKEELMGGDGLHWAPDGLNLILSYIRTHAYNPVPENAPEPDDSQS